jgi:predicted homoserine dehydrogenase-like protein
MSLYAKLQQRAADNRPVRVGLIGAGKFGSMYLAQVPNTPGVHLAGIADLSPAAARTNLARVGWKEERTRASSLDDALKTGATFMTTGRRSFVIPRSTSSWNARATPSPLSTIASRRSRTASTW